MAKPKRAGFRPFIDARRTTSAPWLTDIRCETYAQALLEELDTAESLAAQFEQDITLAAVPEFVALLMGSIARVHIVQS
ncbi:hypothetical protein Bxe_B1985 [Paraburkholderia xenovorans LB400]|uniref:Uncharacterized protein n=1 Tax=Paraburkholderia xenovorans (strain LB400) TaxID=266265 RepID=Q13PI9_PARXL|nr:hypothetical protein Bxe_B1985 [Paraburkholderia xenovorans LB400]